MLKNPVNTFQFDFSGHETATRKMVIAAILGIALLAFEVFNFDTTQFALANLLGEVRFAGVMWATILAIAFCAIDFAGLVRIITPERGGEEPRTVWFLTGAWFLGTIANSTLTWWAVSLSLLSHEFGNEVLSREALLRYVPIFVAMLVWLTRILFIGAFSAAGENIFAMMRKDDQRSMTIGAPRREAATSPLPLRAEPVREPVRSTAAQQSRPPQSRAAGRPQPQSSGNTQRRQPQQPAKTAPAVTYEPVDDPFEDMPAPKTSNSDTRRPASRIQQRPPMPGGMRPNPVQARPTNNRH